MKRPVGIILAIIALTVIASGILAAEKTQSVVFENFDHFNTRTTDSGMVWYGGGNIRIRMDSTLIVADSLIWLKDHDIIHLIGSVEVFDSLQHIWGEKITYYRRDSLFIAENNVVLIQKEDSIRAEAQYVEFSQKYNAVFMENDPWLYLNYPDYKNLVKINADYLVFYREDQTGMAIDNVVIQHTDTRAVCGCAEMYRQNKRLFLMDNPIAFRDSSEISGDFMNIILGDSKVERIDVYDEAKAFFVEQSDSSTGEFSGESKLSGDAITFYFKDDEVRKIAAIGAARSEYFPAEDDTTGAGKNLVSGDSIFIFVENRKIVKAEVKGGAEGIYITGKPQPPPEPQPDSLLRQYLEGEPCDTCYSAIMSQEEFEKRRAALDSAKADTLITNDSLALASDSLGVDSMGISGQAVEDSILYQGNLLEFFTPERLIRITDGAQVRQKQVFLKADRVDYDIPNRIILARAVIDSTDSIPVVTPLSLRDGGEEILGTRLVFNVDTKQGLIEDAATVYESTHYHGHNLFKEEENVFYVRDGVLIPCDKPDPNFYFSSKRMKVIQDDRVIARPVVLYIHKLPVAYIPYYVFPLRRGRHSGILPIKLGNFEKGNRYIGNLGYYWAASEYWDAQGSLDFYENVGVTLNGLFQYNKRYAYNGYVRGTYARESRELAFNEQKSRRWTINGSHSQTLPYDIKFGASGTYVSDQSYYTDYSTNPDERLNRNIRSQANFNKNFGWSSLSVSFNHQDNLDTDSKSSSIPSGRFSISTLYPFGTGRTVDGQLTKKWYNNFSLSYANNFNVYTSSLKKTTISTNTFVYPDGTEETIVDTSVATSRRKYQYVHHSISMSSPQKIMSYITVTPQMSFQETWYYIPTTDQSEKAHIAGDRFYRRAAISGGLSSNTNLYGTFNINQFGLLAMRHIFSPSLGISWAPPVTENQEVRDYAGVGGGGAGRQLAMGMSVTNLIQAKVKSGESEKKLDLLRVSSGTSYNFEATGRKFSSLNTSLSSSVLQNVNISGNLVHDLYDEKGKLRWWSPRLQSFAINSSFQARGSVADDYTRTGLQTDEQANQALADSLSSFPSPNLPGENTPAAGPSSTNWNLNISHSYSEYHSGGEITSRSHFAQITFNVTLTSNWQLKYSQRYDFIVHETIDKVVDLNRKMNCWEGHFYWIPNGSRKGFYFKIYLLTIPDLKVEKSESGLRGALFNR